MIPSVNDENKVVTVIVSQLVKPECQIAYEEWIQGIYSDAKMFPGHLGINVIKPQDQNYPEYAIIFRFDCYDNMKTWMQSDIRKQWLERSKKLIQQEAKVETLTGIEAWFSLPGKKGLLPPPRYKMFLITWLAVYAMLNILKYLISPLIGGLPFYISSLINSGIIVASLTYFIMPNLTKMLRLWLYHKK
jgi:uncharacterized protein